MKLAINKSTCVGQIVTDAYAEAIADTHRVVDVRLDGANEHGTHYVDVWGGTWFVTHDNVTECTVGVMDKWS